MSENLPPKSDFQEEKMVSDTNKPFQVELETVVMQRIQQHYDFKHCTFDKQVMTDIIDRMKTKQAEGAVWSDAILDGSNDFWQEAVDATIARLRERKIPTTFLMVYQMLAETRAEEGWLPAPSNYFDFMCHYHYLLHQKPKPS